MKAWTRMMAVVVASMAMVACGGDDDDGGGADSAGGVDSAAGVDGAGPTFDAPAGLVGSTDFANPTNLAEGEVGSGSLVSGLGEGSIHFFRFVPTTSGTFEITLTGGLHASTTWCGNGGSADGCLCDVGAKLDACCDVAAADCTAYAVDLVAADDGILTVYDSGPDPVTYTVTITAAAL